MNMKLFFAVEWMNYHLKVYLLVAIFLLDYKHNFVFFPCMLFFPDIKIEQFLLILKKSHNNFVFFSLYFLIYYCFCSYFAIILKGNNLFFDNHSFNHILLPILSLNFLTYSYYLYHHCHSSSSSYSHPIQNTFYF